MQHELDLHAEPDAVPRARRFVLTALEADAAAALADDLALIVTELTTNAVLHAGPPITVRVVDLDGGGVRVEVEDPDPRPPLLPQQNPDAMTGRGLALVNALASGWGVEPTASGGKVVWAEVSASDRPDESDTHFQIDLDALDAWPDEEEFPAPPPVGARPVHLAGVPTGLLLETESTVDNLSREFALTTASHPPGGREQLPAHLSAVVDTVTRGFSGPRAEVKRQALAAAARGEDHCELSLLLPTSAAEDAETYLTALDQADEYARAARMLTLESPPAQRVLRRWYVGELVAQLRAQRGGRTYQPVAFEQRLLDELGALAAAQRSVERAARLQSVTAPLAAAETAEEVARVVVSEGMAALGASRAAVLAASGPARTSAGDGRGAPADGDSGPPAGSAARVLAAVAYPQDVLDHWMATGLSPHFPLGLVLLTGEPVWLESPQERDERFPHVGEVEPFTVAACAVPLTSGGHVLAALRLSFDRPRLFDAEERQFVLALAGQAAQALHRSQAYAAERAARAEAERLADHLADTANRLARLQRVTAELTAAREPGEVARVVVGNAASAFGALSAVLYLVGDDGVLHVAHTAGEPLHLAPWADLPLDLDTPATEAVRTGRSVVVPGRADLERRWPLLRDAMVDDRTVLVAPLTLSDRRLGSLVLVFPAEVTVDLQAQLRFLEAIADASAQALERATATSRAAEAATRLAFLAEASVELSGSVDYRTTLAAVARLVVPRIADWCSIVLVEDGLFQTVAVAHTDPVKVAWAQQVQERFPLDPGAPAGLPNVVRTGRSEIHPQVTEEFLVGVARDAEHLQMLRQVGLSSVIIVPLTGRTGTFGAISMIAAESGRHYGQDDLALAEDLARRAALAVETAQSFREQSGRLAAVTRVAEAAQRAILAPVPDRVGPVTLAAAYVSASSEARIGGDLYEVVPRPGALRLLIGDVRGKGLDAVRKATVVLGEFRAAAVDCDDLVGVAAQVDRRLPAHLGDEDFVTALFAEVADDGTVAVVSCGHPPALVARDGRLEPLGAQDSLPLGLGVTPTVARARLAPGDRLFLYTDGLLSGRDAGGDRASGTVDLADAAAPLTEGDLSSVPERVLARLRRSTGAGLGDDLALLVAEFAPGR